LVIDELLHGECCLLTNKLQFAALAVYPFGKAVVDASDVDGNIYYQNHYSTFQPV